MPRLPGRLTRLQFKTPVLGLDQKRQERGGRRREGKEIRQMVWSDGGGGREDGGRVLLGGHRVRASDRGRERGQGVLTVHAGAEEGRNFKRAFGTRDQLEFLEIRIKKEELAGGGIQLSSPTPTKLSSWRGRGFRRGGARNRQFLKLKEGNCGHGVGSRYGKKVNEQGKGTGGGHHHEFHIDLNNEGGWGRIIC